RVFDDHDPAVGGRVIEYVDVEQDGQGCSNESPIQKIDYGGLKAAFRKGADRQSLKSQDGNGLRVTPDQGFRKGREEGSEDSIKRSKQHGNGKIEDTAKEERGIGEDGNSRQVGKNAQPSQHHSNKQAACRLFQRHEEFSSEYP